MFTTFWYSKKAFSIAHSEYFPEPLWLGIYNDCSNYSPTDGWMYNAQYALEYKDKQKTENNLKTKTKYSDYVLDDWKILRPKFGAYFRKADGRLD